MSPSPHPFARMMRLMRVTRRNFSAVSAKSIRESIPTLIETFYEYIARVLYETFRSFIKADCLCIFFFFFGNLNFFGRSKFLSYMNEIASTVSVSLKIYKRY